MHATASQHTRYSLNSAAPPPTTATFLHPAKTQPGWVGRPCDNQTKCPSPSQASPHHGWQQQLCLCSQGTYPHDNTTIALTHTHTHPSRPVSTLLPHPPAYPYPSPTTGPAALGCSRIVCITGITDITNTQSTKEVCHDPANPICHQCRQLSCKTGCPLRRAPSRLARV